MSALGPSTFISDTLFPLHWKIFLCSALEKTRKDPFIYRSYTSDVLLLNLNSSLGECNNGEVSLHSFGGEEAKSATQQLHT